MMLLEPMRRWARQLKANVVALWIASRDRRTPIAAKLLCGAVAAYALSPIDLIPDFIPVLGYVDDLLLVPIGIWLALRLIPLPLLAEYREAARRHEGHLVNRTGAIAIVIIWIAALLAVGIHGYPMIFEAIGLRS